MTACSSSASESSPPPPPPSDAGAPRRFEAAVQAAAAGRDARTATSDDSVEALAPHLPLRRRLEARSSATDAAPRHAQRDEVVDDNGEDEWSYWDVFYAQMRDGFFKHRYNLRTEFPELMPESVRADPKRWVPPHVPARRSGGFDPADLHTSVTEHEAGQGRRVVPRTLVLEAGCGVGNSLIPLLRANSQLYLFAFDFSPTAVDILRSHPEYDASRVHAYVADINDTAGDAASAAASAAALASLPSFSPPNGILVDYVTCVWTLSAVAGANLPRVVRALAACLRRGTGTLLLRDYAHGDLAQLRHPACARVGEREYLRGDGTRVHYFEEEEVRQLFETAGFAVRELRVVKRVVENRKKQLVMHRRWIAGKFVRR